ncbi:tyrosine-type recombinase/integrase [Chloroflexota bacterium]
MTDIKKQTALTVKVKNTGLGNKTSQVSAIQRAEASRSDYVPHLSLADIRLIVKAIGRERLWGERNGLLIETLYDGVLRCSEGIGLRPCDVTQEGSGWAVNIMGKNGKAGKVAISASLAAKLQSHCYRLKIPEMARIFPISRSQCYRIVCNAFDLAGVRRPTREKDRVGAVHVLRHSGAIERLRQTGNPKALQDQLRHKSAHMTLRYLKTLSADESLKIQQGVDFKW